MAYVHPAQLMMNSSGAGSYGHYERVAHPPPHPSMLRAPMPPHWFLVDGRRAEHVPRPQDFDPCRAGFPGVTFSTGGWPGVRVKDILNQKVVVDSPTDMIFVQQGWRATTIALEWPGFMSTTVADPSRHRIETQIGGRPITRQEFAQQISYLIVNFFNCIQGKPTLHGWERWTVGQNGIRPSDIIILSAHYCRRAWVPEFYIIE